MTYGVINCAPQAETFPGKGYYLYQKWPKSVEKKTYKKAPLVSPKSETRGGFLMWFLFWTAEGG